MVSYPVHARINIFFQRWGGGSERYNYVCQGVRCIFLVICLQCKLKKFDFSGGGRSGPTRPPYRSEHACVYLSWLRIEHPPLFFFVQDLADIFDELIIKNHLPNFESIYRTISMYEWIGMIYGSNCHFVRFDESHESSTVYDHQIEAV